MYIYHVNLFVFYFGKKASPNITTKVCNVVKHFYFYTQRPEREGGIPFTNISPTQWSIFIHFSLLERINIALRNVFFGGLYKTIVWEKYGSKQQHKFQHTEHIDMYTVDDRQMGHVNQVEHLSNIPLTC